MVGYWNFEVIQDDNSNGRIGVIDSFKPEQRVSVVNPNVDKSKLSKPGNTNEKLLYFHFIVQEVYLKILIYK